MNASQFLASLTTAPRKRGNTIHSVFEKLSKAEQQSVNPPEEIKMFKLKSNQFRNRTEQMGDLTLHFDASGVASVPDHKRSYILKVMAMRPGRFSIIEPKKAPVVEPVKEAKKAESIMGSLEKALRTSEVEETPKKASPVKKKTTKKKGKQEEDVKSSDSKE